MSRYAIVDASNAPIVHVRVVGEPDDAGFAQYLTDVGEAFRNLDRFGLIFDTGKLAQLPARYREQLSEWLTMTESEFRGRWISGAFVIRSRMIRGVLMTVFWLNKPYYSSRVFANEEHAWTWTQHMLSEAGVSTAQQRSMSK